VASGLELSWSSSEGSQRGWRGLPAPVMKNFSEAGFDGEGGWERGFTCVILDRVTGPGGRGSLRERRGAPRRFDGVLIPV